jgi:translation elongation factor EF-Ts
VVSLKTEGDKEKCKEIAKKLAMHAVASRPIALTAE